MSASVTLFSDRPVFAELWHGVFDRLGIEVQTSSPEDLAAGVSGSGAIVVDAAATAYDEDELLASVGLARALGALTAVQLPATMASLDEVVDELCAGLVARSDLDVSRVASSIARRLDQDRRQRFEYVSVSPRGGALLAIMGDGSATLIERPAGIGDDGSDVTSILLSEDARSATITLESGHTVVLRGPGVAARCSSQPTRLASSSPSEGSPLDGARLGARLRELRRAAGLTQAEVARRTGIHRPNIARVEAGRHTPSLETLARLATAIGVAPTRVLSDE